MWIKRTAGRRRKRRKCFLSKRHGYARSSCLNIVYFLRTPASCHEREKNSWSAGNECRGARRRRKTNNIRESLEKATYLNIARAGIWSRWRRWRCAMSVCDMWEKIASLSHSRRRRDAHKQARIRINHANRSQTQLRRDIRYFLLRAPAFLSFRWKCIFVRCGFIYKLKTKQKLTIFSSFS